MSDDKITSELVERAFRESGFLSAELEPVRQVLRERFEAWFELAERLNFLAQKIYTAHTDLLGGKRIMDPVQIGLQMFPRALEFFQAAILICPFGMGVQAQALVRVVFETNFWIGYRAAEGEEAVAVLRRAAVDEDIKLQTEAHTRWEVFGSDIAADFLASIEKLQNERGDEKIAKPNMATISTKAGFHQHYVLYRELSGGSIHTSMQSIQNHLWLDEEGACLGHTIGPNEEATGKALSLGCLALFGTLVAVRHLTAQDIYDDEITALRKIFDELPH